MQTVHPCIILGSYALDADRMPEDEFKGRMDVVRRRMHDAGLDALVVYGDAREHGALAYLTNFIPRMRWALALLPRDGEPRLLCSVSSRDVPAMRTMTWIEDVYSGWEWKWFVDWVNKAKTNGIHRFGTIGLELASRGLLNNVMRDLGRDAEVMERSDVLDRDLERRRPRELMLVRTAAEITAECVAIFSRQQREGRSFEKAMLEAESHARRYAAQDVRTLVSFDGGLTLEPFRGGFDTAGPKALGYIAVKYMGYWAEGFLTVGADETLAAPVAETLDLLIKALLPGVRLGALHDLAASRLRGLEQHPALQGSIGHAIGLSLSIGPQMRTGERSQVLPGAVYALHVGVRNRAGGCIASALVHAREDGAETLSKSLPQ